MKKKLNDLKNSLFIKKISNFTKQTYAFFNENKLVFIYIFGCLLNGIILRLFTTGNILSIFSNICRFFYYYIFCIILLFV